MQQRSNTRRTIHALAQATAILGIALITLAAGAQQHRDHDDAHFAPAISWSAAASMTTTPRT